MKKFLISAFCLASLWASAPFTFEVNAAEVSTMMESQETHTGVAMTKFSGSFKTVNRSGATVEETENGIYVSFLGERKKASYSDRSGYAYMVTIKGTTWYFNI